MTNQSTNTTSDNVANNQPTVNGLMAFQLIFNDILLTINGDDGVVVEYDKDGVIIRTWESMAGMMRELGQTTNEM